jgi:hypothetical protein
MSDQPRRQVRVRRSPRIGVFLGIGVVVGAVIAVAVGTVGRTDATMTPGEAVGFLLLLLAPLGAVVGGVLALVLDAVSERRARTLEMEAEIIAPPAPPEPEQPPVEQPPVEPERSDRA